MLTKVDQDTARRWRILGERIGRKACHGSAHLRDSEMAWLQSGWEDVKAIVDALGLPEPAFFPQSGRMRLPDLGRVLDWGGGAGRVATHLLDAADEVLVMDASPQLLTLCPEDDRLRLAVVSDPTTLRPEVYGRFDLIIAIHVLYSLTPDGVRKTIQGLAKMLRPGGALVLDVAYCDDPEPWTHQDPDPDGLPGGWWVHAGWDVTAPAAVERLKIESQPPVLAPPYRWSDLAPLSLWVLRARS